MNLKVECAEIYPDDVTGVAWRNPDDVTTGLKIGKLIWPRLQTRLKETTMLILYITLYTLSRIYLRFIYI